MFSQSSRAMWALLAMLGLTRCDCGSPVSQPGSTVPGQCEENAPALSAQRTDILFVIDNSNSMQEEQEAVATELGTFVSALQQGAGLVQDFQVGVITTSVYLRVSLGGAHQFTEYGDSVHLQAGRLRPVTSTGERLLRANDPALVSKFGELVRQGTDGSGQETAFEALRLALTGDLAALPLDQGGNNGLLRLGARLLIVTVGDEDDCSELPPRPPAVEIQGDQSVSDCTKGSALLTPVSTYYNTFTTLDDGHGAPREVVWATIGPVSRLDKHAEEIVEGGVVKNIDCPTSFQGGFRLHEMASRFDPKLENLESICSTSYHDTLLRIAQVASLGQSVDVMNAFDGRLLQLSMTREDGSVELCTVDNGGIRFQPREGERAARVYFQNQCLRRAGDQQVTVKQLCAG